MRRLTSVLAAFLLLSGTAAAAPSAKPTAGSAEHASVSATAPKSTKASKSGMRPMRTPTPMARALRKQAMTSRARPADTRVQQRRILAEPLAKAPFKADFVDIGMGPTGMMAMLAAISTGHPTIGVELRGEPVRGVHQNIRIDWYHTLARIDEMMLERYGKAGIPKLPNGKPFILHDYFYNAGRVGGHLDFPEIFGVGKVQNQNIAGRLTKISFEDAREVTRAANGGKAVLTVLPPPPIPTKADPKKLNPDMKAVLDSPSTFQAAVINYELMLRAYLKAMEAQDAAAGRAPRVKIYENHRVAIEDGLAAGYLGEGTGKRRIVIEEIADGPEGMGMNRRVRKAGTQRIDLGTPIRFSLTAGFGGGADAKTLGYEQDDVAHYDAAVGKSVVARQNWLVGEVTANISGQLIRRISTITDPKTGKAETVRQIAVGHEDAPNVAWVPVQVPEFMTFDPIEAGKVPAGTAPTARAYVDAQAKMIRDYYISQVSAVTHLPAKDIERMRMFYGPSFFTLRERLGKTARIAANGNVAGDLMGNGHFLTSGGAMTGMIGHANRYVEYFKALNRGVPEARAAKQLEAGIKTDSEAWLNVSIKEFVDVSPVNFGAERARQIGIHPDNTPLADARNGGNHGLNGVLGTASWAKALERLRAGEFGKAGVDFYVPSTVLDVTTSPDVKIQRIGEMQMMDKMDKGEMMKMNMN
jgi:hypothetical protein